MDLADQHHIPYPLIQVAGVHDIDEARMLADCGVDLIGIPLRLTVNAEDLTEPEACAISRQLPGRCCLITYLDDPREIQSLAGDLQVSWIQLHGDIDPEKLPAIKRCLPGVRLIKSLIVGKYTPDALERMIREMAPHVDAFITDSYNPASGAEGATGLAHDWRVSRELRLASPRPLILAGGLTADNVAAGIAAVGPHGVDVHTGIEDASGRKCPELTSAFVNAAKSAFSAG
jgi:phosphoribosylanthranilate isomerase